MKNELIKALMKYPQWVYWRPIDGKKVPINIKTGKAASSTDPATWNSFDEVKLSERRGFVLTEKDPFSVIDLDHCIDAHGRVKCETTKILLYFQSYTEISPSGTGFHIWVRGKLPSAIKRSEFEIYSNIRYMTITENPSFNCPLANCQLHLDKIYEKYGRPSSASEEIYTGVDCRDDLRKLYRVSGQMQKIWNLECDFLKADGSPDCSSYDMALAGLLRDWSGNRIVWAIKFFREQHGFASKHEKAIMLTVNKVKSNT